MSISIYDTYCGSTNSGDAIIMDAVNKQLDLVFPLKHKVSYPTHYPLGLKAVKKIRKSHLNFVGGSNLLNSRVCFRGKKNQWAVGFLEANILKNKSILLGCGWNNYQKPSTTKTRMFYHKILSDVYLHSVRDSYSEKKLHELGIFNTINTGCPTLWGLTPTHCNTIPTKKADNVIFTLTDYRKSSIEDKNMIHLLFSAYEKLYFWIQGSEDLAYLQTLLTGTELKKITLINPSLYSYDQLFIDANNLDYVGTRLHAGIRAIQKKCRSIIIGIDNRAIEKRDDFNLMVIERGNTEKLSEIIAAPFHTSIQIPTDNIDKWKAQFNGSQ